MSNAWGSGNYPQQPYSPPQATPGGAPGGVKLFDPSQFQSPPLQQPPHLNNPATSNAEQNVNPQQPAEHNAASNPPTGAWNNYPGWQQQAAASNDGSSVDASQQQVNGQGQYSTAWNQSWDGAGVYAQGGYAQPDQHAEAPGGYPQVDPETTNSYAQPDPQGSSGAQFFDGFGQPQYNQQSPAQGYDTNFNQQLQPPSHQLHQSSPPREQYPPNQQFYGSQMAHQEQSQHQASPPREQSQLPAEASGDQAQAYGQDPQGYFDQGQEQYQTPGKYGHGQEQYQGQSHAFYDQPFDASSWSHSNQAGGEWGQTFHPQPSADNNFAPVNQATESSQEPAQPVSHQAPEFSQHMSNDGDGTVSGFFGRRDDDGDVQSDPNKLPRQDQGVGRPVNQLPADGEFGRADVTEASLDLSREDDEGRAPLNDLQNLVQNMENVHLSQQGTADVSHDQGPVDHHASQHHEMYAVPSNQDGPLQAVGGYSDFTGAQQLPLDTSGRLSPADRDQPESTESGGSGASVGADWEIVPSAMTNSRSSLDNVGFFPDKPDGGVSVDKQGDGDSSIRQSDQGAEMPPVSVPPTHIGSETSSTSNDMQNPPDGERLQPSQSMLPVSPPTSALPPAVGAPPPKGDGPGNPFRKSGTSPRHAAMPPTMISSPHSQSAPVSSAPSLTFQPPSSAFNTVVKDSDPQRSKAASGFVPPKPKIPTSTEDGSGPSKRDSDATRSQQQGTQRHRPDEEVSPQQRSSNSRDSDETSEQRRHQSAFQV